MTSFLRRCGALLLLGFGLALASATAHADPPYRVARLSYESGAVSFSPGGENEWARASINRPIITGDRVWVDASSRAELQLDGAALRIGDQTSVALLNLDDRMAQVQLTQGALDVRVWRLDPDQVLEIDTPNLAFVVRRPGSYRIDVEPKYGSTQVTVRAGDATLYGEGNAFRVGPGDTWEFYDTALRDYDSYRPEPPDELARFAMSRDRRWESSASARHVSRELIGFEELDEYGSWRQVPDYGWAWFPTRVSSEWAPYRDGHWAWVEPWGWTWIDDAPWGFAPSHYGRWAFVDARWCWVPGPATVRPVYAPALVAFIGGGGLSVSVGLGDVVGWFPLGPRDVYRPAYSVSRDYFTRVNVSNTYVNVTQVVNVYNDRDARNVRYANQRIPNAVVAVPMQVFEQAKPVRGSIVRSAAQALVQAQVSMTAPPVAPARQSVLGAQPAQRKPPEHVFTKQVVAQTPPPPPPASIESRLQALRAHPGQPLAPTTPQQRAAQRQPGAEPAPAVRVVKPTQPAAAPPPPAPASASAPGANRPEREQRREEREQRRGALRAPNEQAPAPAATPATPAAPGASPPAAATPAVPPTPQMLRREQRDERRDQRAAPAAQPTAPVTPPAAPPAASRPQPAPQPAAPAVRAPEAAPTPQERRDERRQQREERRGEPAAAPAPQAAPAPAPAPARPQPAPQAAQPAAPAVPAARAPEAAPTPQQRREQREERRSEPPPAAPAARPQPAPQPAPAAPPQAARPQPAPQPAQPPAPQAQPPQRPTASQRAEERRDAASERRREREERRDQQR